MSSARATRLICLRVGFEGQKANTFDQGFCFVALSVSATKHLFLCSARPLPHEENHVQVADRLADRLATQLTGVCSALKYEHHVGKIGRVIR